MIEGKAIIDRFLLDGCYIDSVNSLPVSELEIHFSNITLAETGLYIGSEFYSDKTDKSLSSIKRYFNLVCNLLCFRDQCITIFNMYEDHLVKTQNTKNSSKRAQHDVPEDGLTIR